MFYNKTVILKIWLTDIVVNYTYLIGLLDSKDLCLFLTTIEVQQSIYLTSSDDTA